MFKNDFQGGPCVDVFSIQGKDPLSKVKVSGPQTCVRKEFDKDLKTYILILEGEPTRSKITLPKHAKQSLHLTQQYLVFQLCLTAGQAFSVEVSVTDHNNNTQRIILSNNSREIVVTALHAKMPCSLVEQNVWLNLCLDLGDLIPGIFEGSNFGVTDRIVVSANCQLKRIFTLKSKPLGNIDIPRNLQISDSSAIQVLDLEAFLSNGITIRAGTGNSFKRTPHYLNRSNGKSRVAFGSSFTKTSASEDMKLDSSTGSASNTARLGSGSSRSNKSNQLNGNAPVDLNKIPLNNNEVPTEQPMENKIFHQPRPPGSQSAGKVRKPRVKSADYSKEKMNIQLTGQPLSKSADTRGRRKISDTTNDRFTYSQRNPAGIPLTEDDSNSMNGKKTNLQALPEVRLGRRLSRSAIDLEQTEKLIQENRESHFKSKSLNTLPNIKSNHRYKGNQTCSDAEDDSVFTDSEGKKDEVLPLSELGDDEMIEDYLRRRTASSCHDESSLSINSSCANSTNSDLFVYSSRPRSVTSQQSRHGSETGTQNANKNADSIVKISTEQMFETELLKNKKSQTSMPSSSGLGSSSVEMLATSADKTIQDFLNKENDRSGGDLKTEVEVTFSEYDNAENSSEDATFIITEDQDENNNNNNATTGTNTKNEPNQINTDKIGMQNHTESNTNTNELTKSNVKKIDNLFASYHMRDSCDSDSMSWLHASNDHSVSEKNETNKSMVHLKPSPKLALRKQLEERLGSLIVHKEGDSDDGFSDCSDDTSIFEPPAKFRNYRYQDEIQSIGSTLDLAATIPATPQVGDQARFDNDVTDENNNNGSSQKRVQSLKLHQSRDEELLDLLFDPVLNCYYDPVTHKYYELS